MRHNRLVRIATIFIILGLLTGCAALDDVPVDINIETNTTNETQSVTVQYVVDGDTIVVVYPDGSEDTVRLLGVDTPETGDTNPTEFEGVPDTDAGRACLRTWADRATTYMQNQLSTENITLEFDAIADRRGYYDRLLAYVIVDNTTLNKELIAQGYARLYDSSFEEQLTYASLEQDAMAANRGVWQCRNP